MLVFEFKWQAREGRVLGNNVAGLGWMSDIEGRTLMLRIIADPAIRRGVIPQDAAGNLLNKRSESPKRRNI
jgi:hypothetical protein